jgi:putative flippase GtrA
MCASIARSRDGFVTYPTPLCDYFHKRHSAGETRAETAAAARHNGDMARGARFAAAMTAVTRRLPFGLSGVIAPSLLGYLLINLCTFFLDLTVLAITHGILKWPLPVAVTLSYGSASAVSYVLNRVLNFRSHGALGTQVPIYAAVIASNYLIFVLGLTDLLAAAGVYFELARVIAAVCEAAYLYTMMRWVVFRDAGSAGDLTGDQPAPAPPRPVTARDQG